MDVTNLMQQLAQKYPGEVEYLQAVQEVLGSIQDVYNAHPEFASAAILERLIEPDRMLTFKIPWKDDRGEVHVNLGYRIQFNNAIGPYKGGLRFHPSVNLSILKFLGFVQIFKNALTTLPMGAAKGGSDFDPKGKSDDEIMRFCQCFMLEMWRLIGADTDVSAGDIGVGAREIGYMYGMYKKLAHENTGVLTGKGMNWGGSLIRPEATGYGNVYFASEMLATRNESFRGKAVAVSGFGNVAWGAAQKATELGAKVVTISGPDGYIYDPDGINTPAKFDYMLEMRASNEDIVKPYSYRFENAQFHEGKTPWEQPVDIALPCAIQNELDRADAEELVSNGVLCVSEGANMPSTPEAVQVFQENRVLFGPGKAANAGGVATSGLEMTQNAMKLSWQNQEVDQRLHQIMKSIHAACVAHGRQPDGDVDYVKGANIAGFLKVAQAMLEQGTV
jgi:glutamate dehydrogenase (NADP+)